MKVFVTGASGFIGGSVATRLVQAGHQVRGLIRNEARADELRGFGIQPVLGRLADHAVLVREALAADAVINAASSDDRGAADALIAALTDSGKTLIHTSGSSIVGDEAMGEPSDRIFDEDTPITPEPDKEARIALDKAVLKARGVRSIVLCNTLIYGTAFGPSARSVQLPQLIDQAKSGGKAPYIGRGLNRWSNVHIADVADLYLLALEKAASPSSTAARPRSARWPPPSVRRWACPPPRWTALRPRRCGVVRWRCSPSAPTAGCAASGPGPWAGSPSAPPSSTGSRPRCVEAALA